ncbi:basic amino acid ABC transporter substrate-binding protein [Ferdinandcohnia quinoae]|uniref:Basic amino acid ABC transporter substrate-binding protein n=1 Tax=Fredinandcohnia quinoae TaxID=2918902 RepID=A0AAW5ECH0_9BACI|nr:basic amino acid ABC transporter substrate-binding protein [Fredinandcohnia sp. SECRCQ15]MCH1626469.1 basic amino acid ABC transporter substrate-binding protein [Fredinandcohnia sp. SECRCQ15]
MKRILLLAMTFVFIFVLAACGSKDSGGDGKTLKVATDAAYAPFEYTEGDKIVGFDIDVINAVAEEAGYELNIVNTGWDPLFLELDNKTSDVGISAISITDDRKVDYDFTLPYFLSINKILVPEDSDIQSADDLLDKVVAVQGGTTGHEAVEKLLGEKHKNIKSFENNNLAIMELESGGAEAVVADNGVIEWYVKNNPDKKLKVVGDKNTFDPEYYGMMFPKGTKDLKVDFDKALEKIIENGTYEEIYSKWFVDKPDLETLKAQQESEK